MQDDDTLPYPDEVTEAQLAELGLADPGRAKGMLMALAGQGVTDDIVAQLLPSLFEALRQSPDPDRALNNFARWTDSVTSRYTHFQYLLRHPAALAIFFNVCGVSQFFSDILIRNPEYFEILANENVRRAGKTGAEVYRELSAFVDAVVRPELKLEAMRRFRQREVLRIGTRDILGLADLPATARDFSNLADACVQKCYDVAVAELNERYGLTEPFPFVVLGMGKLGGVELNYSSDIDLMFVCADPDDLRFALPQPVPERAPSAVEYAHKLAEKIVNGLSANMQNGHLFRVDMRLRPEGRFGALVRTLSSYQAYYESWAEPWERQSLLKTRPVAGDPRLAEAFMEMVTPFVYRRTVTSEFVEAIRHNKERIEKKAELEGKTHTNVKIGYGGIRDIEFTVQLLQLEMGGRLPLLRTPTTLEGLARLRQIGVIRPDEAAELSDDYCFLRTVEHRLQILYEMQTQALPTEPDERRLLARRLGYPDAAAFDADYARRTERVHGHFTHLFYGGARKREQAAADVWVDLLVNVETAEARREIEARLAECGFRDPKRGYEHLKLAAYGGDYGLARPEAQEQFLHLAARLVTACSRTGDPDAALDGIETLALAMPNRAQLYRTLDEGEEVLDRLVRLGANSLPLVQTLSRHLEWMDMLVSDEIVDPAPKSVQQSIGELDERASGAKNEGAFWDAVALYIQRERLRIGARDIWGEANAPTIARELTGLAEAVLQIVLDWSRDRATERFPSAEARAALDSAAVIGLGKLGGRELGYGSDWDIVIVYADDERRTPPPAEENVIPFENRKATIEARKERFAAVNALAEALLSAGQALMVRNAPVEIDARLRPEGRFGALVRTVREYRDYYLHHSLTWERQVLTKARPVAGDHETGRRYMHAVHEAIYRAPLNAAATEEIRHMKRRIETERLKSGERFTDVKLGHGGMSDIEFTAQLWQLKCGAERPQVRQTGTAEALNGLAGVGALPAPDVRRLTETYNLWTLIRNRLSLLGGLATDALPVDPRRLRALAVGLGAADTPEKPAEQVLTDRFAARMSETRSIVARLFYGS